jgi:hypothetical protein
MCIVLVGSDVVVTKTILKAAIDDLRVSVEPKLIGFNFVTIVLGTGDEAVEVIFIAGLVVESVVNADVGMEEIISAVFENVVVGMYVFVLGLDVDDVVKDRVGLDFKVGVVSVATVFAVVAEIVGITLVTCDSKVEEEFSVKITLESVDGFVVIVFVGDTDSLVVDVEFMNKVVVVLGVVNEFEVNFVLKFVLEEYVVV